jgi:RNA polymerase sigma factor (sigma-70 family)
MIQEGAIGFMRALDKFDPKSGFALLTYAGFWVKQRLSRGYDRQARVIYVPDRLSAALVRLSGDVSGSIRNSPESLAKKIGVKPEELAALIPFTSHTLSLSSPITGTERTLGETLSTSVLKEVEIDEYPDDLVIFRQRLTAALGTLTHKERDVLTKRFGLDGKGERTLQEIADDVGLTKERIRQIQNRALEYLKNGPAAAELERLVREMGE